MTVKKPTTTIETITPRIARDWLSQNTNNRNLRKPVVDVYARDMKAGRWVLSDNAITFGADGSLLNGQHRLHAIVASNTSIQAVIMRGVQIEAQRHMDAGARRSASDMLSLSGKKNSSLLAATIRNAITVEAVGYAQMNKYAVTHGEIEEYLAQHPDIEFAVELARQYSREIDCLPALVAYSMYRFRQLDPDDALRFFHDAARRVGLQAGDPVLAMGKRFAEARRNREIHPHAAYLSVIFRCWNARRAGQSMSVIRINSSKGGLVDVPEPR